MVRENDERALGGRLWIRLRVDGDDAFAKDFRVLQAATALDEVGTFLEILLVLAGRA
jgi:hypothetical protein